MTVAGGVIGAERLLPRHGDGDGGQRGKVLYLLSRSAGKVVHLRHIRRIGTAGSQRAGEAVLPTKAAAATGMKPLAVRMFRSSISESSKARLPNSTTGTAGVPAAADFAR